MCVHTKIIMKNRSRIEDRYGEVGRGRGGNDIDSVFICQINK